MTGQIKFGTDGSTGILKKTDHSNQIAIFSFIATAAVVAVYTWFALSSFKQTNNNYYSQLAVSFKRNELYLQAQPSSSLLSLNDPYDYAQRKQNNVENFPWDVSLYKSRFYLYWGPVPSILLMVFSDKQLSHLGDNYLTFAFALGLFFYSMLLAASFWLKFYQNAPPWMLGLSLLTIGLSAPITMMLKSPRIYEAAILGCQFFFIGGCYWAYSAISNDSPNLWKLAFASLHWALALGTRVTILPAVVFLAIATTIYILRKNEISLTKKILLAILAVGIPLLISIAGLSWYNWQRFDSIFEFGLRYQLTSTSYTGFQNWFSTGYINANLINYFLHPLKVQTKFPYLMPIENTFSNERLAGLLYISPYILLALIPMGRFLYLTGSTRTENNKESALEGWLITVLAGSSLISLAIILSFFFPAMRYAEDFIPALLLLTAMYVGWGYIFWVEKGKFSKAYLVLVTILAIFSVIASILIALPPHGVKDALIFIQQAYKFLSPRP